MDCGWRFISGPSLWKLLCVACALIWAGADSAHGESVGSKNKTGNRLFEQGKYQEAEKAYIDAQGDAPGKSELLYNLGNTLLKQKKYDQALQALRQAIGKGDKGLQAKAWFNSGDALFDKADYQDAAQAFIQALRINPGDRDAKQNLELALKKMQEQQKQQQGQGKDKENQNSDKRDSKQEQQKQSEGKQGEQKKPSGNYRQDKNKSDNPKQAQADRQENSISKERAMQILDALRNQELQDQRKLLEHQPRQKAVGKDW